MFQLVIATILCLVAVVMAFFRRLPAAAVAFAGMLVAGLSAGSMLQSGQLWFWGIAAAIVTVNLYMSEIPPVTSLRLYTVGGALAGTAVGAAFGTMASLIVCGAVGAFLGFEAFRRTPDGRMNAAFARRLMIFADVAIPAIITFFIAAITLAQLPLFRS